MKTATSYFAQLRNFKPYMVPISTCVWDPKWFHNFQGHQHRFIDKHGILNGLRCSNLVPGESCNNLCRGREGCAHTYDSCPFLIEYRKQLAAIPEDKFIKYCDEVATYYSDFTGYSKHDLILVFIVYEKYDNPCSERKAIQEFLYRCGFYASELEYPINQNYM